jgi:hypothetical protein
MIKFRSTGVFFIVIDYVQFVPTGGRKVIKVTTQTHLTVQFGRCVVVLKRQKVLPVRIGVKLVFVDASKK